MFAARGSKVDQLGELRAMELDFEDAATKEWAKRLGVEFFFLGGQWAVSISSADRMVGGEYN